MSAADLIFYHAPRTRSFSILWIFEELGQPAHDRVDLNLAKGDHKTKWYMAINPMGKVPALLHGGTVVTEAAAIAMYLADLFPEAGLAPAVDDPARGTYLRWIVFNQAAVEPAVTDLALKREPGSPAMMSYGTYDATIDALSGALRDRPYILGDKFSVADVIVGSGVRWMLMFKLLPERCEFVSYAERLTARPALQRAKNTDSALLASFQS